MHLTAKKYPQSIRIKLNCILRTDISSYRNRILTQTTFVWLSENYRELKSSISILLWLLLRKTLISNFRLEWLIIKNWLKVNPKISFCNLFLIEITLSVFICITLSIKRYKSQWSYLETTNTKKIILFHLQLTKWWIKSILTIKQRKYARKNSKLHAKFL
jgi:hypothetical protein